MTNPLVDILLVEDNDRDVELTIRALRKCNLLNPLYTVKDGAAALDFIFCQGAYADRNILKLPKVILLDLNLPKLNGLEVLKAIKSDVRTRTIPVVVVTSSHEDEDIKKAYALGANSYIVKPVQFESFADTMSNLGFFWMLVNQPPS